MQYKPPEESISVFNRHYKAASSLANSIIIFKEPKSRDSKLSFWNRRKAHKAIQHLHHCLALLPEHWPSLWVLGKVHEALGEHHVALINFAKAARINPDNIEVLRSASIAAVNAGASAEASKYSAMALELQPTDAELWCNHAVNLMVNGEDDAAVEAINKAMEIDPDDEITQNAHRLIISVASGLRARPTWRELAFS